MEGKIKRQNQREREREVMNVKWPSEDKHYGCKVCILRPDKVQDKKILFFQANNGKK